MQDWIATLRDFGTTYGLRIIGAIVILTVGRIAAGIVRRIVRKVMEKAKSAPILISFVGQLCYALVLTFAVIAALGKLGVQTTSFVAVVGAAGLAIGLAMQGSLANFAAGVLIVIFRPFKVGDVIEAAGVAGKVEEIEIFTTRLTTPDNKLVIIPNAQVTGGNIVNYTVKGTRRIDLVVGVAYDADLKRTREVLMEIIRADERILVDPAPVVAVSNLGDSSVDFVVRPWVKADDYWDVYFSMLEKTKLRLDQEGIGIPFPQRDVHLFQHAAG